VSEAEVAGASCSCYALTQLQLLARRWGTTDGGAEVQYYDSGHSSGSLIQVLAKLVLSVTDPGLEVNRADPRGDWAARPLSSNARITRELNYDLRRCHVGHRLGSLYAGLLFWMLSTPQQQHTRRMPSTSSL
jgi:hypothetical protein